MIKKKRGRPSGTFKKTNKKTKNIISIPYASTSETEVEYLRRLVFDLSMKLASLASESRNGSMTISNQYPTPFPSMIDQITGKSMSMEAKNEQEQKEKNEAPLQINRILGAL